MTSAAARISTHKSASRLELGASAGPAVQMGGTSVCSSFLHRDFTGVICQNAVSGQPAGEGTGLRQEFQVDYARECSARVLPQ
jgi:hypothetical protein